MGEENRAVERCGIRDRNRAVEGCGIGSGDEIADCVVDDSENSNGDENDTDFLVLQATARIPESEVSLELRLRDISEDQKVEQFMTTGCSCTKWKGNSCSFQFTSEHVKDMRLSCMELTHSELDLIIMGQVLACTNTGEHTVTDVHHIAHHDRKHQYTNFLHQGHQICIEIFRFLHVVGAKRLKNIVKSIKMNGIAPRIHGNIKRMPLNTFTLKEVQDVIYFLLNYCEKHALLLPDRVPGYSRTDIKLLPSSTSKRRIWNIYKETAEQAETHVIAYSTFCRLWKTQLPYIVLMKPMTDLCWKCQQNGNSILRAANSSDSIKSARIEEALEHLRIVQVERSHYRTICKECEREIKAFFTNNNTFTPPPLHAHIPSNSVPIKAQYSFDYAQQVHFPSDPMQPGPIYFLTPRKCSVFGVNCEAIPRQVNILADEAGDCGKGSNTVISQLHYFFENHGLGEKEVYLHADNCTGQNKNNMMLQYLAWRVMTGRHTQITLSFLVVGHTKFSPDWCFGLFKRLYRRTKVGSLKELSRVVNDSACCNFAQLVTAKDATSIVPIYNWADFFVPHMKKLLGIKKYHHFRFTSAEPGVVYVKNQWDTAENKQELLKTTWVPNSSSLPDTVIPKGLSSERQWYLFEKIRPFCPLEDQDLTCPQPTVPKSTSRASSPHSIIVDDNEVFSPLPHLHVVYHTSDAPSALGRRLADSSGVNAPSAKKPRVCSKCKQSGHNSRTCSSC